MEASEPVKLVACPVCAGSGATRKALRVGVGRLEAVWWEPYLGCGGGGKAREDAVLPKEDK